MTRPQGIMSDKIFHKIVKEGKEMGVGLFVPFLNGEPFANPKIFKWLDYLQNEGVQTLLYTNAGLLTKEKIDRLVQYKNIKRINCSINAASKETYDQVTRGPDYQTVVDNVKYLIEKSPFRVTCEMTIVKENIHEVEDFVKQWKGHNHINTFMNWAGKRHDTRETTGVRVPCSALGNLYVLWDGRVCLCCFDSDGQVIIGDLNTQSLREVWDNAQSLRDRHAALDFDMDLCRDCNVNCADRKLKKPMKLSIIIAFYNSHGAVKRQIKHFAAMNLPDDIEFIFVDDGSNPPHNIKDYSLKNLILHHTYDKRPWTQGLARNAGAKIALGEYLLMTDIDHILSKEAIMESYNFTGEKMIFPRYFGVLLEDGRLSQETEVLIDYGLDPARIASKRGLYASVHGNTFCIKKKTFFELGMYDPRHCNYGHHAASKKGEDGAFNAVWNRWAAQKGILPSLGSKIYHFPIGRYTLTCNFNPHGLFHNLSQAQEIQPNKP